MASVSPPKPWERAAAGAGRTTSTLTAAPPLAASSTASPTTTGGTATTNTTNDAAAPAIPARPSSLGAVVNRTASAYTTPGTTAASPYGSTVARPYGGASAYTSPYASPYGGMSSYGSPYSRFGGGGGMYGSSMYGGGVGGMYGGAGGMYGGAGGMYGGGMYGGGMPGDPNDPANASMANHFQQSTQATFQIIESIVGAFGGFAQMLESTYMATHSSFFAMVSVAEQFSSLRHTLGSVLGIFTVLRWSRTLLAKLTGRPPPADATALTPAAFSAFTAALSGVTPPSTTIGPDGRPIPVPGAAPKPSKKPFIVFVLAVFGLPYLMGKLIGALSRANDEAALRAQQQQQGTLAAGPLGQQYSGQQAPPLRAIDPANLDFCRVLFDFPPPGAPAAAGDAELDLHVAKGDLVAVLDKAAGGGGDDGQGAWWRCRARDGRMGYLPAVYLQTIQKRAGGAAAAPQQPPQQQQRLLTQSGDALTLADVTGASASAGTGTGTAASTSRASTMPASVRAPLATAAGATKKDAATAPGASDAEAAERVAAFQKGWVGGS